MKSLLSNIIIFFMAIFLIYAVSIYSNENFIADHTEQSIQDALLVATRQDYDGSNRLGETIFDEGIFEKRFINAFELVTNDYSGSNSYDFEYLYENEVVFAMQVKVTNNKYTHSSYFILE